MTSRLQRRQQCRLAPAGATGNQDEIVHDLDYPADKLRRCNMSYVDGVVAAVPEANKEAYIEHARQAAVIFREFGATQVVECWGDDVPEGKINSMHTAVQRKEGEAIIFSWIIWPSKEIRDAGWGRMMEDSRMADQEMPFDGSRMIFGGFSMVLEA
jgi:uncharacterized protein YbaA (DUF1428 family)